LLAAVELVKDKSSRERLAPESGAAVYCRDRAIEGGLMVRQTGDAMIMSPPFVTTTGEIDALIATLAEGLDKTATHFGVKS
jgi:putrescine aminotransferase